MTNMQGTRREPPILSAVAEGYRAWFARIPKAPTASPKRPFHICRCGAPFVQLRGCISRCPKCSGANSAGIQARWRLRNPGKNRRSRAVARASKLRCKYGLTTEQYGEMLDSQSGVCAICCGPDRSGRQLAVDHCHITGKVRGLLCGLFNKSIGKLNDSPDMLRRAIAYLEAP